MATSFLLLLNLNHTKGRLESGGCRRRDTITCRRISSCREHREGAGAVAGVSVEACRGSAAGCAGRPVQEYERRKLGGISLSDRGPKRRKIRYVVVPGTGVKK